MLALQAVVAAMHTWNGKRVNWAQIDHQKTVEEVQIYREKASVSPGRCTLRSIFQFAVRHYPQGGLPSGSPTSSGPPPQPIV